MITLQTQPREASRKGAALRAKGVMPAVLYGPKEKTLSISISGKDFQKIWKEAGESTVIKLETSQGKKSALIHDVQFDPVRSTPIHADFYVIEEGKEVEVDIPIEFIGVAPAVKDLGGTLVKVMHELPVKGMPDKLPHEIKVDISALVGLESRIAAGDLALPQGITLMCHAADIIASVAVAKEEVEITEPIDLSTIEVEKKGKKEEEGEVAEATE